MLWSVNLIGGRSGRQRWSEREKRESERVPEGERPREIKARKKGKKNKREKRRGEKVRKRKKRRKLIFEMVVIDC